MSDESTPLVPVPDSHQWAADRFTKLFTAVPLSDAEKLPESTPLQDALEKIRTEGRSASVGVTVTHRDGPSLVGDVSTTLGKGWSIGAAGQYVHRTGWAIGAVCTWKGK